jgi:hypothetical protein
MKIDLQALRDDLWAHRWVIERQAAVFGYLLGIIFGFSFIIWSYGHRHYGHPAVIATVLILWCIELAASIVFSGALPIPMRTGMRWRYKLGLTQEGYERLRSSARDDFTGKWTTLENRWMWVSDETIWVVGLVRLEDFVLAKLKFSPYVRRPVKDLDDGKAPDEWPQGPSAGPHHTLI